VKPNNKPFDHHLYANFEQYVWLLTLACTVRSMPVADVDVTTLRTVRNRNEVTPSEVDWSTTEPILDDLLTETPSTSTETSTVR